MRLSLQCLIIISIYTTEAYSNVLGPRYPAPLDLTSDDSVVTAGWKNVTSFFDTYLHDNRSLIPSPPLGLENLTFSTGMFSIHDPAAQSLQYHYTSDEVRTGPGVHEVDGDSIYKVASITKLITVFTAMLSFDVDQWERPITDFVPGLSKSALDKVGHDRISHTQWEDVSLRALAAQIAGVSAVDLPWGSDSALTIDPTTVAIVANPHALEAGLPPLNLSDPAALYPCLKDPILVYMDPLKGCPPDLWLEGELERAPAFDAWTTPAYANNGFILLGIALANITGKPITQVYDDLVFDPLGMAHSKAVPPTESEVPQYVSPGNTTDVTFQGGLSVSSGGLFSSLNDLATFGTALMNSTLLPANKTREWMKPISHTADLTFSVGAPWEIYRYIHADTGAVTDMYTKSGDAGNFTGFAVMLPDYDAGFNIISAGNQQVNVSQKSHLAQAIADIITTTLIPALEAQAVAEVKRNFAGTYASKDPVLNSSLTLTFDESASNTGLYISSWISNGTDMVPLEWFGPGPVKLQPSTKQPGQQAFRALPVRPKLPPGSGPFATMFNTNDWLAVYSSVYGAVDMGLFVFDIGADGRATCAEPAAVRAKLERVE
ncbi:beta-lactamase/transpeptidase-like protein [Mytilinidion resinicola]|uniref:Beta-lactamase/transpeptidase-like protein n=1 Tax=Mytilinidion resinicola TaxID=574789 RepID=A0A6A6Y7Y2_9PEZI|nr:beta-lactamase/transpeptidase-like protein [Mytilinidion resinicola]KAF2803917.1 beta-lactamase/transpeptidase-like protein [Mytilinidion resinicola]